MFAIVSKTMASKVVERSFNKEMSIFAKWRSDTVSSLNQAFSEDIKLWKGYRFIKSEDDVSYLLSQLIPLTLKLTFSHPDLES